MKKILEDIRKDKIIHYIIIVAVSLIASIPLINLRIYGTDDGFVHILRIFGTEQILKQGIFPPFIYSNFANGFGYAINLFYSPFVTYGPLIFRLFKLSYSVCLKLFAFSTILISCFTMYNFLYEISKKREIAILGAVIYAFIPYRLETIFNRFAIGEFTAYIFFPVLFQGLYNLLKGDGKKHYYIAIAAIGLILTHTISTEYSAIFALLYTVCNFKRLKNKDVIKKIAVNVVFTLSLTAFFTVPLIEHKIVGNYVIFNQTSMRSLPSDVQNSTINVSQLFKDIGEVNGVSFKVGIPLIVLTILGVFVYKKIDKELKEDYIFYALMSVITLIMVTKLFPWIIMPKIFTTMQFSWRMLAFFEFSLSIICAINLYYFIEMIAKNKEKLSNIILALSIVLIVASMMKINYNYSYEAEKTLTDNEYERQLCSKTSIWSINRDYLPDNIDTKTLNQSYVDYRENRVYVLDKTTKDKEQSLLVTENDNTNNENATIENEQQTLEETYGTKDDIKNEANIIKDDINNEKNIEKAENIIKDENKQGLQLKFNIENYKANTVLELPYIYYLGYTVTIEQEISENNITGQETVTSDTKQNTIAQYSKIENVQTFESNNGMLAIKLDEDINNAHISVKYTGTVIEKISYVVSAISAIIFIGYIIYYKNKLKG